MLTIRDLWFVWLIGFICCAVYLAYNQWKRMQRTAWYGNHDDFYKGIGPFMLAGVASSIFMLLLVMAFILYIVSMFQ
jgi:cbb3-type cytochrome oxidase subunit 3